MVNNHDDDSMLRVPNNSKDAIEYILNSKDIDTILGKTSSTRRTNFRRLALLVVEQVTMVWYDDNVDNRCIQISVKMMIEQQMPLDA